VKNDLLACLTYPPAATQRTSWRLMTLTSEAQVIDLESERL
jgi:hypothetical protein